MLAGIEAVVRAAAVPAEVQRNRAVPDNVPAQGLVVIRDGDMEEPERDVGELTYLWERLCSVDVLVQATAEAKRIADADAILVRVVAAMEANRSFGVSGVVSRIGWPAVEHHAITSAAPIAQASIPITVMYETNSLTGV